MTAHPDPTELAEALCARLCHDLAGPLSTIMGVLEIASEDPGAAAEALEIGSQTAQSMALRLRLLRAAWAGDCGPMNAQGIKTLASGLPPRVRAELGGLAQGPFDGKLARVLLNMLLLGVDALPRGGTLVLSGTPARITLQPEGLDAVWPDGLAAVLNGGDMGLADPRTLQMPLTSIYARMAGRRLLLGPAPSEGSLGPLLLME